jgi:FkbM family methyltransferase
MQQLSHAEMDASFLRICSERKPKIVCDVGTRDCGDAIRIKQASPHSEVFAFEANPENYFEWCLSNDVKQHGIQVQLAAVSDTAGSSIIRIPHYASRTSGGTIQQRGTSSLRPKAGEGNFVEYPVPQTTLDVFFRHIIDFDPTVSFAFWIDVEGLALEVLRGMRLLLPHTLALKIEVEERPYYEGQALGADVLALIAETDALIPAFTTDPAPGQRDLLFLPPGFPRPC